MNGYRSHGAGSAVYPDSEGSRNGQQLGLAGQTGDERIAALYGALAAAQGAFPPIPKNRTVVIRPASRPQYEFRYADLEAILSAVRKPLADNGLAVVQSVESDSEGHYVVTRLVHKGGGSIVSSVRMPKAESADPKVFGSLVTYYRRYALCPVLGVAADDDLDEDGQEAQNEGEARAAMVADVLKQARAAAAKGLQSYEEFWKSLSKVGRALLADHHAGLKKLAAEAGDAPSAGNG